MAYQIPLFDLNYDAAEERAVLEVLRSKWISMGPRTAELEQAFASHTGARHAVAVSNCTAALHLALAALGVGPGDEVIVPSLTFVATVNCVGYVGAKPVFADVTSDDNFSISPVHARRLLTSRTKAIIAMHYGGFACDMAALIDLARDQGVALVEDGAHAPDTRVDGKAAGTFGAIGCFSFYANKNIACGEGGLLTTDDDALAARLRLLRSHGMTTLSFDRARGHATEYDVVERGYNFRIDDIHSALVLAQLRKLKADTEKRGQLRKIYLEELSGVEAISIPYASHCQQPSHYIMPVMLRAGGLARREELRRKLAVEGIQTSVHYPAAHRFSIYRGQSSELPITERVADHELTLPLYSTMTPEMVRLVADAVKRAVR